MKHASAYRSPSGMAFNKTRRYSRQLRTLPTIRDKGKGHKHKP